MRIITRHYRPKNKQWGIMHWRTHNYAAFDFFWGKHLFVIGFRRGEE